VGADGEEVRMVIGSTSLPLCSTKGDGRFNFGVGIDISEFS
jgi:hypothetical protein